MEFSLLILARYRIYLIIEGSASAGKGQEIGCLYGKEVIGVSKIIQIGQCTDALEDLGY